MRMGPMVVLSGLLFLTVACGPKAQPAGIGQCFRVRYDAGGQRAVIAGHVIERHSETHIVIKEVVTMNGEPHTQEAMDVTSGNIAIDEGSCYRQ
jgi:hypothetical protein